MFMTTLMLLFTILGVAMLIATRPDRTTNSPSHSVRACVAHLACHATERTACAGTLPHVSRNHWERRDLTRMLMTDDDYNGRITPSHIEPSRNPHN